MKNYIKIILFIFCIISLFSCRKNIGKASWDIDADTPLFNSSLTVNNILADSLIQVNADSSLKIVYNNTLYSFSTDSLVDFPDTIKQTIFHIPFTVTAQPGQQILNTTDNKNLDLNGAVVTKLIVKSGFISFKFKNTIKEKILYKYRIPCATKNGIPFEINEMVPAASLSEPVIFSKQTDISGYTIDLTGVNGTSYNVLTSITQASVDVNGHPVEITPNDGFEILVNFDELTIGYAKGFFGTHLIKSGQQTSNFDLFNKITEGTISLEDIHMALSITNGLGVDASAVVHEIKSINSHTGNTVSLNSSLIESVININRAQETYNPASPANSSVYEFNLDNSNIKQLVENLPDKLEYSLDVTTDPMGNVSCGNDFIYNPYGFKAALNLEIPLSLIATNLTLTDTLDFNIDEPTGYSVNSGMLTLIANNGFPFDASAQIFLLDENNFVTDSLITTYNTIYSAPLDSQNKAIGKKKSYIKVPVSGNKLEHLYNTHKIIIVVRFNTAQQGSYIKIYSDYVIDLILTGDFNLTVNEN